MRRMRFKIDTEGLVLIAGGIEGVTDRDSGTLVLDKETGKPLFIVHLMAIAAGEKPEQMSVRVPGQISGIGIGSQVREYRGCSPGPGRWATGTASPSARRRSSRPPRPARPKRRPDVLRRPAFRWIRSPGRLAVLLLFVSQLAALAATTRPHLPKIDWGFLTRLDLLPAAVVVAGLLNLLLAW